MAAECYPCRMTARLEDLPPREKVHLEGGWRVAHAFNSTLPGWLVLVPTRHVTSLDELTALESEELGLLARKVSIALRNVTGCEKTYLALFAEAEGFGHLHVHLVPRDADLAADHRGPGSSASSLRMRRSGCPRRNATPWRYGSGPRWRPCTEHGGVLRVRKEGLEPSCPKAHGPKPCVSTVPPLPPAPSS